MKPPTMPSVSKLSSRVICILGQNPGPFTLQGTNTYIIGTGPKRILVDTGEGKAEYIKLLQETLRQESVAGISEVVLTHHHRDHVGGVRDVLSVFGDIPVWKSTPVENKLKRMRDVEGATSHEIPDAPPYRHFEDGHVFSVEGATLEAISTPGHTNDHMALKLKEENAILSGDCILGFGTTIFACLSTYMASLERLRQEEAHVIYPGHGPVLSNAKEKVEEYIEHRMMRERQILDALHSGGGKRTCSQIVRTVYPDVPWLLRLAAQSNAYLHLEKLEDDGAVRMIPGSDDQGQGNTLWQLIEQQS
eukprot:Rmarinus@m.8926